MGKHYRDMEMEEQLWYSLPISEDLAASMEDAMCKNADLLALHVGELRNLLPFLDPRLDDLNDSAVAWMVEDKRTGESLLVCAIEQRHGGYVAHAMGGADFWTALAVEDALMEVLS